MHDERRRIEERVERVHNQRIKPAIYAATVPFEVEAWQAPGEPVPFEEAAAAPYEPFAMDTPWGPPAPPAPDPATCTPFDHKCQEGLKSEYLTQVQAWEKVRATAVEDYEAERRRYEQVVSTIKLKALADLDRLRTVTVAAEHGGTDINGLWVSAGELLKRERGRRQLVIVASDRTATPFRHPSQRASTSSFTTPRRSRASPSSKSGAASQRRRRWRLRSSSGQSSYSVRLCSTTEFFSHCTSPGSKRISSVRRGSFATDS